MDLIHHSLESTPKKVCLEGDIVLELNDEETLPTTEKVNTTDSIWPFKNLTFSMVSPLSPLGSHQARRGWKEQQLCCHWSDKVWHYKDLEYGRKVWICFLLGLLWWTPSSCCKDEEVCYKPLHLWYSSLTQSPQCAENVPHWRGFWV